MIDEPAFLAAAKRLFEGADWQLVVPEIFNKLDAAAITALRDDQDISRNLALLQIIGNIREAIRATATSSGARVNPFPAALGDAHA